MDIRRLLIALVAVTLAAATAPAGARPPSCWPLPDSLCPADPIVVPRVPTPGGLPPAIAPTVANTIASVNEATKGITLQNPAYSVWPDTNIAIVGDSAGATVYAPVSDALAPIFVRYGGRMYVQNLTLQAHTITDADCVNDAGAIIGACKFRVGMYPLEAGMGARFLPITTSVFERNRARPYGFRCEVHPAMKGWLIAK